MDLFLKTDEPEKQMSAAIMADGTACEQVQRRGLYLLTRTPLHVGAGGGGGAVDLPIQRERHTGFPVIPATTLKGVFADEWTEITADEKGSLTSQRTKDGKWLFGETEAENAAAGAIQLGEGKLLAFPVRSAKGCFAWITSPLILRRASRDSALRNEDGLPLILEKNAFADLIGVDGDAKALFNGDSQIVLPVPQNGQGKLKVVLEEYVLHHAGKLPDGLASALERTFPNEEVWQEIASRLVILSDGAMRYFAQHACEIAQHVRINDITGTAMGTALFNQENVPSDTLFYSVVNCFKERRRMAESEALRSSDAAWKKFEGKVADKGNVFQFGGSASTGLGFCAVETYD